MPLSDLPALFDSADTAAVRWERRFMHATVARSSLAVLAAVLASFAILLHEHEVNWLGLGAAAAFTGALVAELWVVSQEESPEEQWYVNRALAESARTLAWRYAVGSNPFPKTRDDDVEADLEGKFDRLMHEAARVFIDPSKKPAVTRQMASLRAAPLDERRKSYLLYRFDDQFEWYSTRARYNSKRASAWRFTLVVMEILGVLAGLATGLGYVKIDLTSIISTMLGAAVAWLAVRQHHTLGKGYAITSHVLVLAGERLKRTQGGEPEWAQAVAEVEDVISREHTKWRAARSVG
jgi:hypothetical protein